MEIYKLKDEIPEGRRRDRVLKGQSEVPGGRDDDVPGECKGGERGGRLVITDLKQGVKNPNRVNVYVNSQFALSLDVAQVVELGIKVGRVISSEELAEYRRASEFGKMYQRTLEWVLTRPRSLRETKEYLWRKLHKASSDTASRQPVFTGGARFRSRPEVVHRASSQTEKRVFQLLDSYDDRQQPPKDSSEAFSELSQDIITRLLAKGYIDDRRFAEWYVENRFVKKGVSQKRLKMELMKKGVDREIIDEVLGGRDDEEEVRKMIAKKRAKYDAEKMTAYLCRQGFAYDLVKKMIEDEY